MFLNSLSWPAQFHAKKYLTALPLTAADRAAGIASDERLKRLGTPHHKNELRGHQLRLVKVQRTNDEGELETWWLLTNKLDLAAELVALGYRYRWTVELFFRWLKGCDPKMGLRCISLRLLTCGYVRHLLVVRIAQNAVDFSVFKGVGSQILGDRRLA